MRDRAASVWSFALVLFAGCHSPLVATPEPRYETVLALREQLHALERQQSTMLQLFATTASLPAVEPDSAIEQNALLTRIAVALEAAHDANARPNVADAASNRQPTTDTAAICAMQRALQAVERQRTLLLENLANVQTPGYRRRSLRLSTELQPGTGLELPVGRDVVVTTTTGALEITGRNLDVAIDGEGFHAVQLPDGRVAYTRDSHFAVGPDGTLRLGDGAVLHPQIRIPTDTLEVAVDPEGRVYVRTASAPDRATLLGQMVLHTFVDLGALEPIGGNLLQPDQPACRPLSGTPGSPGFGCLKQGFLERSNVQIVDELVELDRVRRQLTALRRQFAQFGVFAF